MKLNEWKDSKGNKITSTTPSSNTVSKTSGASFKKRLNKLINYYGQHLPANIDFITVNLLTDDTLDFTEYTSERATIKYNIYIGPMTEAWRLKIYKSDKLTDDLSGLEWVELLKTLRAYITIPVVQTPEYKSLLTEWLDSKGNKINGASSQPGRIPDQTYRYKRLLAQIESDGLFRKYKVNTLDESTLDITLGNGVEVQLVRQPHFPIYKLTIEGDSQYYDDYEDILDALIVEGIIGETDLCESASFAEDFKTYENLWD